MTFFESMLVAFSTYSVIPMPQFRWNEKNMKYALCFFPLVGLVIAGIYFLWYRMCMKFSLSAVLFSAVGTAIPVLISGGIHMDGFMDTVDAISSHRERERKLEILKDPNCGAFAVIYCIIYFLLFFAFLYEAYSESRAEVLAFGFVLSRCLSGILAMNIKNARKSGMLYAFTEKSERKKATVILLLQTLICAGLMLIFTPLVFQTALVLNILWCFLYKKLAVKQFGGITGDTAGFFLQISELLFLLGVITGALLI